MNKTDKAVTDVRDSDGTLNVRKYEDQQDEREAYARASGRAITDPRTVAGRKETVRQWKDRIEAETMRDHREKREALQSIKVQCGFIALNSTNQDLREFASIIGRTAMDALKG